MYDRGVPGERRKGLVLVAAGAAFGAVYFGVLIALSHMGVIEPEITERVRHGVLVRSASYNAIWGIPFVIPLFTTLFGLIRVVTGRPFAQLAKAYETMSGGRRFVVSVLVVALALVVIFGLVAIAFAIML